MIEVWAVAPGHPEHIVSTLGRVRHRRVNAPILKGYVDADGYRRVRLDGRERRVHRLVCEAFNGPPPPGTECAHADNDPLNNEVGNLRWATHADNVADTIRAGRFSHNRPPCGETHPMARLSDQSIVKIREGSEAGLSQRMLASKFGVNQSHVSRILAGHKRPKDIAKDTAHDQ